MKNIFAISALLAALALQGCTGSKPGSGQESPERTVVAYVTSWSSEIPAPSVVTHINYAFGHVNSTFDGVRVDNPDRLRAIVALKSVKPSLKVLVSVGGWGSGNFSEMAADQALRESFAASCLALVLEYGLDGIDIDWEYPTSSAAGISSSPDDTGHFNLLIAQLRETLGSELLLTMASEAGADFVDFRTVAPLLDFVNIMSYDMGWNGKEHSALYRSPLSGDCTSDEAVKAHIKAGVPAEKLVMGVPFYGRGAEEFAAGLDYREVAAALEAAPGFSECWDETAMVPYIADASGRCVFSYDNVRSLEIKCDYILSKGLKGAMYWDYSGDNCTSFDGCSPSAGDLATTLARRLL